MSYNFEKAEPVVVVGGGSKKADNPFTEAVASIAWKTDDTTGKPLALSFTEEHDAESAGKVRDQVRRRMRDAGLALETPGTVRTAFTPMNDKNGKVTGSKVTFWVVKLQERPREKK